MKFLNKIMLLAVTILFMVSACEKVPDLPFHPDGIESVLSSSATTLAPLPADSNKTVLTLDWTSPEYATDSATVRFIVQIDSAGRNFSKATSKELIGSRTLSLTAKELNTIMLNYGFQFNKPYNMDMRVISSYNNNNERRFSNTVKLNATPYKIPPKVALPTTGKLYLVGDATQGGWSNPVPVPNQELTKIDETTYGGIFNLVGGKQYLVLPLNGNWDNKYAVANNTLPGLSGGGDFGFNLSDNFPGPAASGWYTLLLDFQTGKFTVTPFTQQHGLPDSLYIVGDATPGGWNNPVPTPSQKFTRINSTRFEIASIAMTTGKAYLLLPENGNWGKKFGAVDDQAPGIKVEGPFKPEGLNIPAPDVSGNYKIAVDFINNRYSLTKL
jgi:starch-binding outer membrane protein SusE/F